MVQKIRVHLYGDLPIRKTSMTKPNSVIIWEGKSLIDGGPIVALLSGLTTKSGNDKTGDMAQVDIVRSDIHPIEAVKQGLDYSICGECPLRMVWDSTLKKYVRVCYVNLLFAPSGKFKAYLRGSYPVMTPEEAGEILRAKGKGVRQGSYGDPFAVPIDIWDRLHKSANTFTTSYTHQWMLPNFNPDLFKYSMASVDHVNTVEKLRELYPDVRYYRMAKNYDDINKETEVKCPSKNTKGERVLTCSECKLCFGGLKAKNVVIVEGE